MNNAKENEDHVSKELSKYTQSLPNAFPLKFISKVGDVFDFENKYNNIKEFKVGDVIGSADFKLVMPFNTNKSIYELAKTFNLWESSRGINETGNLIEVIKMDTDKNKNPTYICKQPALVGDIIVYNNIKNVVIYASNEFRTRDKYWAVSCVFGILEKPKEIKNIEKLEYYKNMLVSKQTITTEMIAMLKLISNGALAGGLNSVIGEAEGRINTVLETEEKAGYGL